MEGPLIRFTTAEARPRDGAMAVGDAGEEDCSHVQPETEPVASHGPGYYDDSEAKLANQREERELVQAIHGIHLARCRTVAEVESGRKTVSLRVTYPTSPVI